jgi:hypothetical protein
MRSERQSEIAGSAAHVDAKRNIDDTVEQAPAYMSEEFRFFTRTENGSLDLKLDSHESNARPRVQVSA